jgi:hypothetical protein
VKWTFDTAGAIGNGSPEEESIPLRRATRSNWKETLEERELDERIRPVDFEPIGWTLLSGIPHSRGNRPNGIVGSGNQYPDTSAGVKL